MIRERLNQFVGQVDRRETYLALGAIGGALVIMAIKSRPVVLVMMSDEMMNAILKYNGVKFVPK